MDDKVRTSALEQQFVKFSCREFVLSARERRRERIEGGKYEINLKEICSLEFQPALVPLLCDLCALLIDGTSFLRWRMAKEFRCLCFAGRGETVACCVTVQFVTQLIRLSTLIPLTQHWFRSLSDRQNHGISLSRHSSNEYTKDTKYTEQIVHCSACNACNNNVMQLAKFTHTHTVASWQ